jgi:sugar lactone lactonase YvrE
MVCGALALLLLAGRGAIGQAAHFSGVETKVGAFVQPMGVTVDESGNVYVADADTFEISEIEAVNGAIPASPVIRVLTRSLSNPEGVAVDSKGDVYFTTLDIESNYHNNSVSEILAVNGTIPASPTVVQLGSGLYYPSGVAVDNSGNVYVADTDNDQVKEMLAVNGSAPTSPVIVPLGSGFVLPTDVAVDKAGNVYVVDQTSPAVKEILAVNGSIPPAPTILALTSSLSSSLYWPDRITLDGAGNLYASDYSTSAVFEMLAVNGSIPALPTVVELGSGISAAEGLGVDTAGDIYVAGNYGLTKVSAAGGNFGAVNIGTMSAAIPLTFTFDSAGTLGATAVLTQGATGLDFADAGTGTCAANTAYIAGQSCTVSVTFAPQLSGPRYGSAVLKNASGQAIATGYVQGIGVGPQVAFMPGVQSVFASSTVWTEGVAVDAGGNVYISINSAGLVYKETLVSGSYTQSVLPTSKLSEPQGVAVDGSGAVYVADTANWRVLKETPSAGTYSESTVASFPVVDGSAPVSVAVDGSGNVFIAISDGVLYEETLSAGSYVQSAIPTGVPVASGVAVDGSGNIYVMANQNNGPIVKETPSAGSYVPSTIPIEGQGVPTGVAVDAAGDLYVTFIDNGDTGEVFRETPQQGGGYTLSSIPVSGLNQPFALAVDGSGNLFVTDSGHAQVVKLDFADVPNLSFSETRVGHTSSDSPQTVTLENIGNATLNFPVPTTGANPSISANFSWDDSQSSSCPEVGSGSSTEGVLAAGASCALPISFTPTTGGYLNGSLVLVDNNLNAPAPGYSSQSIALSGSASGTAVVITWPTPAPITYGTALSKTQLNATASVSGSFSYSPSSGTKLSAGTYTLTATFTPKSSSYGKTTATVTLLVNQATPKITWSTPKAISYGTALSSTQLDATANVPGNMTYNPAAGTIPAAGTDTLTAIFTPTDTTDYTSASATVTLTVNAAPSFSLSASPSSASVNPGSSGTSMITVTVQSGSPGNVNLSVFGLPTGVTASFSSNPTSSTSRLTLKASKKASTGTSTIPITITGTSDSVQASTTVWFTVL